MRILSIDTSCDETSAAVTQNLKILSNVIWSQASLHTKFGGVYPSLARREHEKKIDWVINKSLVISHQPLEKIDTIAVTVGPGLAIALEVGIKKAKELAKKYNKKLIAVNHLEGHLLSCLAEPNAENDKRSIINIKFPALGLIVSGGNTLIIKINKIGSYKTLAETQDDALGEALDKAARVLGLGYPGGPIIEKFAKAADPTKFSLPLPLVGDKVKNRFSYSGLKTAFIRLFGSIRNPGKQDLINLAAAFQDTAFRHITTVLDYQISHHPLGISHLLLGGGVAANVELRKRIRKLTKKHCIKVLFPYNKRLYTDNAAMIGIAAYFKARRGEFVKNIEALDRLPRMRL